MNKIKLALVVNRFPSLSESFIFNKVEGLTKAGFSVTLISHNRKNDRSFYASRINDFEYKTIYSFGTGGFLNDFKLVFSNFFLKIQLLVRLLYQSKSLKKGLRHWVKLLPFLSSKFDIIHFAFSGIGASYFEIIDHLEESKILMSCRGSAEKLKPLVDKNRAITLGKLFKKVDKVHCVSHDMIKTLKKYGLDEAKAFVNPPSIVVKNFSRFTDYKAINKEKISIVSTGRLSFQKGFIFAIMACKILKEKGIPFTYEIIGGGPELGYLTYVISEMGLEEDIILLGRQSGQFVKKKLESADIFLLTSIYEGIANAALEAMAMELPVLSVEAGGMGEAITHDENGKIVERFNPQVIAEELEKLILNPEQRLLLGKAARKRVIEDFNMQKQISTFVEVYKSLVVST